MSVRSGLQAMLMAVACLIATAAHTADAPPLASHRPVRMLLGYPPGGGGDILARILARRMATALRQPVVVDNRAGASGALAAAAALQAAPDGETVFLADSSLMLAALLQNNLRHAPTAFTPVGAVGYLNYAVVVHPGFAARNLQELIDIARSQPGKLNYASPGVGTLGHAGGESLRRLAGLQMTHIPYKGGGQALADLASGEVPIGVISLPPALAMVRSGKLRVLAVTSRTRSAAAPDVPAASETLAGFHAVSSIFLLAPPGTPSPIVQRLHTALRDSLASPEAKAELAEQGVDIESGDPAQLAIQLRSEWLSGRATIRSLGLTSP